MKTALIFYSVSLILMIDVNVDGIELKLKENPRVIEPDCNALGNELYCTAKAVNNWCRWNEDYEICEGNYERILFISTWDVAAMPKSVVSFYILCCCMILFWFSGFLTRKLKIFQHIESDKLDKCQIYIFETFGLTISVIYLLYEHTFDIIYAADDYIDIEPKEMLQLVRSLSAAQFLMYMYLIEMLTTSLRWSLQLHHVVVIFIGSYYMLLLDDFGDLATTRCVIALCLFSFTEINVFPQLLLYRVSPLYSWKIHFVSAVCYTMTRLFVDVSLIYCYIGWAMTDEIYNQFHKKANATYIIFFFLMPILTILLNVAQFQTVKALFYVSNSTRKRIKVRNELLKYPRLQELYDIFIEFDSNINGYWTMVDWKKFVFYHSTFIRQSTCILMWNCIGFTYNDDPSEHDSDDLDDSDDSDDGRTRIQSVLDVTDLTEKVDFKRKKYMKWKDLRKIFGKHLKDEKLTQHPVKQVISAQLQILLETIYNAQTQFKQIDNDDDKHRAMLKLRDEVNKLIDDDGISVPNDNGNDIEMYITKNDILPSPEDIQYATSLDDEIALNKHVSISCNIVSL